MDIKEIAIRNLKKIAIDIEPKDNSDVAVRITGTPENDALQLRTTESDFYLCPPPGYEPKLSECRLIATRADMERLAGNGRTRVEVNLGEGHDMLFYRDAVHQRPDWSWFKAFRIYFDGGASKGENNQSFLRPGWWQPGRLTDQSRWRGSTIHALNGIFTFVRGDVAKNVSTEKDKGPMVNPFFSTSGPFYGNCYVDQVNPYVSPQRLRCRLKEFF